MTRYVEFELLSASLSSDEEQAMANLSGLGTLNDNRITVARMHLNLIALRFLAYYSKAATGKLVMGTIDPPLLMVPNFLPSTGFRIESMQMVLRVKP